MARIKMTAEEKKAYRSMSPEERAAYDEKRRLRRVADRRHTEGNVLDINPEPEEEPAAPEFIFEEPILPETMIYETDALSSMPDYVDVDSIFDSIFDEEIKSPKMEEKRPAVDLTTQETLERKAEEKKEIYLNLLLDGTFSFTRHYRDIYYVLNEAFHAIDADVKESKGYRIYYGLTVLHEKGEPVLFEDGYFTNDVSEFLHEVRKIEFYGGDESGKEDINAGIEASLRILANHTKEYSNRGLIFITDSKSKTARANFTKLKDAKYNNLRFVVGYLFDPYYGGQFNIVDGDGNAAANGKNHSYFMPVKNLLNGESADDMKAIVKSILRMVSVWVTG